jgi:hypothetical protein
MLTLGQFSLDHTLPRPNVNVQASCSGPDRISSQSFSPRVAKPSRRTPGQQSSPSGVQD